MIFKNAVSNENVWFNGSALRYDTGSKMSKDDRQMLSHEEKSNLKRIEVFIQSMTPEEREHPELMNSSRKNV